MKKDLAVLIIIVAAILAFILGYSLSPSPVGRQGKQGASTAAPGYGNEKTSQGAAAPGYGSEPSIPATAAPGYDDVKPHKPAAPGYDDRSSMSFPTPGHDNG